MAAEVGAGVAEHGNSAESVIGAQQLVGRTVAGVHRLQSRAAVHMHHGGHAPRCEPLSADPPPVVNLNAVIDNQENGGIVYEGKVGLGGEGGAVGISHPCSAVGRWRWLALVDVDGAVRGARGARG